MDQSCQLEGEDLTGKGRLREPSHEIFPDGELKKKKTRGAGRSSEVQGGGVVAMFEMFVFFGMVEPHPLRLYPCFLGGRVVRCV